MKAINSFSEPLDMVREFHNTAAQPVLTTPQSPPEKRVDLRIKLMEEELREFIIASVAEDLPEVLDALVDMQYILLGTVLEYGMADLFEEAFKEVHNSNMSKFCNNTLEAKTCADSYTFHRDERKRRDAYSKKVGKHFVIRDSYTEKILKGPKFFQPKLKEIIEKYTPKKDNA